MHIVSRRVVRSVTLGLLLVAVVISATTNRYKQDMLCLYTDEAANGVNGYALAHTGKDEFGRPFPFLFESFGEWKMPMNSYVFAPLVRFFGLSKDIIRIPNFIVVLLMPVLWWALLRVCKVHTIVAACVAILLSASPWWAIVSRHAFEGTLAVGYLVCFCILVGARMVKRLPRWSLVCIPLLGACALLSYHSSKLVVPVVTVVFLIYALIHKGHRSLLVGALIVSIALQAVLIPHIASPRVAKLAVWNTPGLVWRIEMARAKGATRLTANKLTFTFETIARNYTHLFTPAFLLSHGDGDERYGVEGTRLLTWTEYLLFLSGIVVLLWRLCTRRAVLDYVLFAILLVAPLSSALTWLGPSLSRALLFLLPVYACIGYTLDQSLKYLMRYTKPSILMLGCIIICGVVGVQRLQDWRTYFYTYLPATHTRFIWNCNAPAAVAQMSRTVKAQPTYLHAQVGMPHIYLPFFGHMSIYEYQRLAKLTPLDENGFGRVERLGNYIFRQPTAQDRAGVVVIEKNSKLETIPTDTFLQSAQSE